MTGVQARWGWVVCVTALAASCVRDDGGPTQHDASPPGDDGGAPSADAGLPDAGVDLDAGPATDGGGSDAGLPDGGPGPDGGAGADAGESIDAGTRVDGGTADGGTADGGTTDGGTADGGTTDGGLIIPDGGLSFDAGVRLDGGVVFIDAGVPDAGGLDGGVATSDAGLDGPVLYVGSRTQSPIDLSVARRLQAIAAQGAGRADVFAKIGDSISTSASGVGGGQFLNCFDGPLEGTQAWDINVRLGAWSALAPTITYFQQTRLGSDDSWTRASTATRVGAFAHWAITGTPSPLDREVSAIAPRFAVVMFGSNDIGYFGPDPYPLADQLETFEGNMRELTDELIARGVVPLLTTMPPDADPRWHRFTPAYSGVVRAIAQGRQVPLIDLQRELLALGPPFGLGSDGTHPTCAAWNGCCWFDPASLQHGYNVRNLITLQAFDRMRKAFSQPAAGVDPVVERLQGTGTATAPFQVTSVPFAELRALRTSPGRASGTLSCGGQAPVTVSGPQVVYRLTLMQPKALRIVLLDDGARVHRVSLLSGSACLRTGTRLVTATLPAGTYLLQVNAQGGVSPAGEYNLSVTECLPGDPDC